jgi:3-methyladenine DNA glycosylase/8-oxoguanine DNA glycosylase
MQFTIPARLPFNFRSVVFSHGWNQLQPFVWDETAGTLSYILCLSSGQVIDLVTSAADSGLKVDSPRLGAKEKAEVINTLTWMFALNSDFSEFYQAIRDELALANVEKLARGRVLRSPTLFEDVIRTILTTNTLWAATRRMVANLVQQFGEPLPSDPTRRAFPTALSLAAAGEGRLRAESRLGYRAPYIVDLAQRVASGEFDLEALKTSCLPTLELRRELLKIQGIGPYASANLLMILGRSDYLPIDSWALKVVSHEWHADQPVTPAQVQADMDKWGRWQGLVFWFWDWSYNHKDSAG